MGISSDAIVGASASLVEGKWSWPVHGLRHPAEGDTSGWYVWTGDFIEADDFFHAWHVGHLVDAVPQLAHLLELPAGSRFLIAPEHEDVWTDSSLLELESP